MNVILKMKFGSHLYGTDTPASDLDIKGIYLPTAREIVLGNYKKTVSNSRKKEDKERNTKDDTDTEIFSLDRYLVLLMDGQTVALDMLFAPNNMHVDLGIDRLGFRKNIWSAIYNNREKLLTRNVNAFVGYARQQAAKYGIKGSRMDALKRTSEMLDFLQVTPGYLDTLGNYSHNIYDLVHETAALVSLEKAPLVEVVMLKGPKGVFDAPHLRVNGRSIPFHAKVKYAKEVVGKMLDEYGKRAHKAHLAGGLDWKSLSHAVRVNNEALELLQTGHITFPRPDRQLLLDIKLGTLEYDCVANIIEHGLAELTAAHEVSTLRDEPDRDFAEDLIYRTYSLIVKEDL